MFLEISKEYLSTFNRQIQTQLYNELRQDYSFPRVVCRSRSDLFTSYEVPAGVPVEEMHLVPVKLSLYEPDDCTIKNQQDLMDNTQKNIYGLE